MRESKWLACICLIGLWAGCGAKEDHTGGEVQAPPGTNMLPGTMGGPMAPGGAAGASAIPGQNPSMPGGTGATTPPPGGTNTTPPTGAGGSAAPTDPGGAPTMMGEATSDPIPESCQAYPLLGMKYSPGGDVLPNKCAPWHPTYNNPYAIRCIDAIEGYDTGFPGDEFCILPPPPDKGLQVGFYPQGDVETYWKKMWAGDFSDYKNPPKEWVLEAGGEITENYRAHSSNMEAHKYYRTYFRMRTGSHHNIITMHMNDGSGDKWMPGSELPGLFDASAGQLIGVLGGQQRPDDGQPVTFEKPAEDKGQYLNWPVNPALIFNLHHFNTTDRTTLREGWSNIWWEEDATQLVSWYMGLAFDQVLLLSVAPEETQDLHYFWSIGSDVRLLRVFGHRHAWTSNFSSWIKHANGENELLYQSYDWFDMPTYRYDSAAKNPPLNPEAHTDGAVSGIINLKAGDELHFNCHVEYTQRRAQAVNAPQMPSEQGTLRFANEAFKGEMCIQFGNVTGGGLGLPAAASDKPPAFATSTAD